MALAWVLSDPRVTSVIIGTSSVAQLDNNLQTLDCLGFSDDERRRIYQIVADPALSF